MYSQASASNVPRAPKPAYPYQQPSSYDLMLASQSASALSSSTPSLVARSLASTPSSSTLLEPEGVRGLPADEAEILYVTGLDHLDLSGEETHPRWGPGAHQAKATAQTPRLVSEPQTTAPSFKPNPHAAPYIPTIVRRRATADPHVCGIEGAGWQPRRAWMRAFRAGSVTAAAGVRRGHAEDVVGAGPWDTAIMSELAARFVERAAEGCCETLAHVAPLAVEVHRCFRHERGEGVATSFLELLKQHLLSEFRAWWLATLPSSVANIPACAPSPPHAPAYRSVSSALAIAVFVGDLFAEGLIKGAFVQLCMNMLLDKLSVLEELESLHAIVLHAGERLYDRVPLSDFLTALQHRCATIPLTSVCGNPDVAPTAEHHTQAIANLVDTWAAARATPAPSEFSEPASEYSDYNPEHTIHRSLDELQAPPAEKRWADVARAA